MAKKAKAGLAGLTSLGGWNVGLKPELKREFLWVAGIGAVIGFFFTQGLVLWNEDYGQWLNEASRSWGTILGRILSPMTSSPETWGANDRPLQVLLYKLVTTIFGTGSTAFYVLKAAGFGLLFGMLHLWARRLGASRVASTLTVAAIALSGHAIGALVWHANFGVYTQVTLVFLLFAASQFIDGRKAAPALLDGLTGRDADYRAFLIFFWPTLYLATKLGPEARAVPWIVLLYLAAVRRKQLRDYAPFLTASVLITLPWSTQLFRHLPPMLRADAFYQGGTYAPFSLARLNTFLFKDLSSIASASAQSLSLFAALGIFVAAAMLVYYASKIIGDRLRAPRAQTTYLWVWMTLAVLGLGCTAFATPGVRALELPTLFAVMVPMAVLVALGVTQILQEYRSVRWAERAAMGVLAIQLVWNAAGAVSVRRDYARLTYAASKAFEAAQEAAQTNGDSKLLLAPGFGNSTLLETANTGILATRTPMRSFDDIQAAPVGKTLVVSWDPSLDSRLTVVKTVSSCGTSVFDSVFSCKPHQSVALLRYVGTPAAVTTAQDLDKKGDIQGARRALTEGIAKDPGNFGLAFHKSLYDDRVGDYAAMEQVYDRIGPYFPWHTTVVYNWGLAKKGVQKYAESTKLLKAAYQLAGKGNYAIGFNLAESYYQQGKRGRALAQTQELLKFHPGNSALKNAYDRWSR